MQTPNLCSLTICQQAIEVQQNQHLNKLLAYLLGVEICPYLHGLHLGNIVLISHERSV